jgi:hypothetical protein
MPATGPPPIRFRPAGGATSPPPSVEQSPPSVLRLPPPPPSRSARHGRPPNSNPELETLTLRSAASTTTPAGGDLAAGRSPTSRPALISLAAKPREPSQPYLASRGRRRSCGSCETHKSQTLEGWWASHLPEGMYIGFAGSRVSALGQKSPLRTSYAAHSQLLVRAHSPYPCACLWVGKCFSWAPRPEDNLRNSPARGRSFVSSPDGPSGALGRPEA